jgi:lipopolysaccharide export system ATP-binding protein
MSDRRLVARGLRKALSGRQVVGGVDLEVLPGRVVGLLGPNGAGKTTCFKMITGILRPDAGTVELDGVDLGRLPLHRRVQRGLGYLPQEPSVFRSLTVRENVGAALEAKGRSAGEAGPHLEALGLAPLADASAGKLSGGERRRLEIARCLALEPSVLLLDEPFAGVDPVGVQDLQERIRALAARGLGILLTDHAVREALGICDEAIILDAGTAMARGTPEQVASDPAVRSRYLGDRFGELPPRGVVSGSGRSA